jgi:DnaJ family protein A protein 5
MLEQTEKFGMSDMESELQKLEDQLDANEEDELFCVACNKEMRNEKAFATHRTQKKHLENVRLLKEVMIEEDLLNSDDLKDSDDELEEAIEEVVDIVQEEQAVEEEDVVKPTKKKNKKKAKLDKSSKKQTSAVGPVLATVVSDLQCAVCMIEFSSKNKLFSHLKSTGHAVLLKS